MVDVLPVIMSPNNTLTVHTTGGSSQNGTVRKHHHTLHVDMGGRGPVNAG